MQNAYLHTGPTSFRGLPIMGPSSDLPASTLDLDPHLPSLPVLQCEAVCSRCGAVWCHMVQCVAAFFLSLNEGVAFRVFSLAAASRYVV